MSSIVALVKSMSDKLSRFVDTFLGLCMAVCLSLMSCLVFLNVVLRYLFDSGITWSEEMSRYLFVFMIFFGTASAMKAHQHLSVDLLTGILPRPLRILCGLISGALMLYAMGLLIQGGWTLIRININTTGPATGMPLWLLYAGAIAMGVFMAGCILVTLWRLLTNRPLSPVGGQH